MSAGKITENSKQKREDDSYIRDAVEYLLCLFFLFFFLMIRRPPRSTLILTLFPYTTALPICAPATWRSATSPRHGPKPAPRFARSEEHTSELQSHSEISYAVFCLKKKKIANDKGEVGKDEGNRILVATDVVPDVRAGTRTAAHVILISFLVLFFFFNDTATTEIYTNLNTLSLHDALPISSRRRHTRFLNVTGVQTCALPIDRKSTRLEHQSHSEISYAVFCLRSEERRVGKEC